MSDDPRIAQLVTTNKIEDYLPATPQQAVDQAHGMILAGMLQDGVENTPETRVEAAERLRQAADDYVGVVKRAMASALAASIPRADPTDPDAPGTTPCKGCGVMLHKVPGGNGMVWVHEGAEFRFCT